MASNSSLVKLVRCKVILEEIEKGKNPSRRDLIQIVQQQLEYLNDLHGDIKTEFSESTLKRDLVDIKSVFNVNIENDRGYYIAEESTNELKKIMEPLEAVYLKLLLTGVPDTRKYIRFTPRKATKGIEYFTKILKAIKNKKKIQFLYHQYEKQEQKIRLVSPLGLKEAKGFWYLIASDDKGIKTFGIDRIDGISISLENAMVPDGFDLDEYYKHCYGIVRFPNSEPEEIIIKTTPIKAAYYKANPLHHSQKIIEETKQYTTFRLYMYLTYDLQQELHSHMPSEVQVLKPEDALDKVRYY